MSRTSSSNSLLIVNGPDVELRLRDKAGNSRFVISDIDTFPVQTTDSKGNLKIKGGQGKL